ncbi:MAG: hypothetical protein ABJ067_21735, partial [Anderseniella sp.]
MIRTLLICTAITTSLFASPQIVAADSLSGAYLAGRQAAIRDDFEASSRYYTAALARDPSNVGLMEDTIATQLAMGRIDRALPIAKLLEGKGIRSQAAHMTVIADMFAREAYDD